MPFDGLNILIIKQSSWTQTRTVENAMLTKFEHIFKRMKFFDLKHNISEFSLNKEFLKKKFCINQKSLKG